MADLSDVLNSLVTLAAAAVYPGGTALPSVCGTGVRIYAGWPNAQQLDVDLANAMCHVSIYALPGERNMTRYAPAWQPATLNTPTLTLAAAGQTVTVGGTIPTAANPHVLSIGVNGVPAVYLVQPADTLASIAAALAALITGAVATGAVVTLAANARIGFARVGVTGTSIREVRRQERQFQIGVWADTPARRDTLARSIDAALAFLTFVTLPDLSQGRLIYKGTNNLDKFQKDRLYRRDLNYSVEYATTQTETETQITQEQVNTSAAVAGVTPTAPTFTTYF